MSILPAVHRHVLIKDPRRFGYMCVVPECEHFVHVDKFDDMREDTMSRRSGLRVCSVPGCPEYTPGGRCPDHQRAAERERGTARQRGYGSQHEQRFRPAVLARDPVCTLCGQAPSVHADHHPHSRRELVDQGLDPNDPRYGRGLCGPCHSSETAKHQPGGWNA